MTIIDDNILMILVPDECNIFVIFSTDMRNLVMLLSILLKMIFKVK